MGFISHHEIEQELVGDGVRVVIMSKFSMGDVIGPRSGVVSTEDLKVCFNFLVYLFCFSVRLQMISGGEREVVFQEFSKFLSEGGGKLGAMIRDDFVIKAKVEVYFVEKEGSYSFGGDVFLRGTKNHPLVSPWLTATKRESKPEDEGRSVIRSQETCWKGRDAEE